METNDTQMVYVSITGLTLKGWWGYPLFVFHAFRSAAQIKSAQGNISVETWKENGVYHTLTAWENEAAMKRFLYRGAHRAAIKVFSSFATGKTYGFQTDKIPDQRSAVSIWQEKGRNYHS